MAPMGVSSGHVYANEVADAKPDEHSDAVKLHELHAFGPATPAHPGVRRALGMSCARITDAQAQAQAQARTVLRTRRLGRTVCGDVVAQAAARGRNGADGHVGCVSARGAVVASAHARLSRPQVRVRAAVVARAHLDTSR